MEEKEVIFKSKKAGEESKVIASQPVDIVACHLPRGSSVRWREDMSVSEFIPKPAM